MYLNRGLPQFELARNQLVGLSASETFENFPLPCCEPTFARGRKDGDSISAPYFYCFIVSHSLRESRRWEKGAAAHDESKCLDCERGRNARRNEATGTRSKSGDYFLCFLAIGNQHQWNVGVQAAEPCDPILRFGITDSKGSNDEHQHFVSMLARI
jgi:hypothetical protein